MLIKSQFGRLCVSEQTVLLLLEELGPVKHHRCSAALWLHPQKWRARPQNVSESFWAVFQTSTLTQTWPVKSLHSAVLLYYVIDRCLLSS